MNIEFVIRNDIWNQTFTMTISVSWNCLLKEKSVDTLVIHERVQNSDPHIHIEKSLVGKQGKIQMKEGGTSLVWNYVLPMPDNEMSMFCADKSVLLDVWNQINILHVWSNVWM